MWFRVETDRARFLDFLVTHSYPFATEWEPDNVDSCLICRVEDDDGIIGYIWGHFTEYENVLTAHVCASAGKAFDWKRILPETKRMAFWLGADEVQIAIDSVDKRDALGRLLRSLGFSHIPDHPRYLHCYRIFLDGKSVWKS